MIKSYLISKKKQLFHGSVIAIVLWIFTLFTANAFGQETLSLSPDISSAKETEHLIFNPTISTGSSKLNQGNNLLSNQQQDQQQTVPSSQQHLSKGDALPDLTAELIKHYQLGHGDMLQLNLLSKENELNLSYPLSIAVDGSTFIPSIGTFQTRGLTIHALEEKIIQRIRSFYPYPLSIALQLISPRSVSILVTGQVTSPGPANIYAYSPISRLISRVGGIARGGSTRNIEIIREGKTINVDLFRLFRFGDTTQDIPLKTGDHIHVPLADRIVEIKGEVHRPGKYELKKGESMEDLLHLAGGLTSNAVFENGNIYSRIEAKKRPLTKDAILEHEDIVLVPSRNKKVQVLGAVENPGIYEFYPSMGIKDLIKLAGGLKKSAAQNEYAYLERNIGTDQHESIQIKLSDLLSNKIENEILNDGDILNIREVQSFVYVYGEVDAPGKFPYIPGKKLSEYINDAGGPKDNAALGKTQVVRNQGENAGNSEVITVNANDIIYGAKYDRDIVLKGGDVVRIPPKFFYFKDFSSFSNLILSVIALVSVLPK